MKLDTVEEKQICQYLLGKLAEEEQQRLEERLMTQDDLFEQLQVLEDELIDKYLKDTLSREEKGAFEKHFLAAPERHQKLLFAQALRKHVTAASRERVPQPSLRPSFWQSLLAALRAQGPALRYGLPVAILGAFLGCLRMAGTIQRLHTEVAQIHAEKGGWQEKEQQLQQQLEEQRRHSQELEHQLVLAQAQGKSTPTSPSARLVALALAPGLLRDSGTSKRLTISSETLLVELRLELADHQYENYRAVLQDEEGSEILTVNKVKPERIGPSQFLVLTLPAKALLQGDYSLKLSGASKTGEFDPLGKYDFGVLRR